MPHPTTIVKVALITALRQTSVRTLFTLNHYFALPVAARGYKANAVTHIQTHLQTPQAREQLRQALMPSDTALFWSILAARDIVLPPTVRRPWQLAAPWPALADLQPLERLMALGCLVPTRTPRGLRVLVPDLLADYLQAITSVSPVVALPPSPTGTALLADALLLLGMLAAGHDQHPSAVFQHPEHHPRLLAALHHQGLLEHRPDQRTITPGAAVFVGLDAGRQRRRLLTGLTESAPTAGPALPGWWSGMLHWARRTLARWADTRWSIATLAEMAEAADPFAHHPISERGQVVRDQLIPVLHAAGLLRTDGQQAQLTADGLAWADDQPLPLPTPQLPALGLIVQLPPEAPAMLQFTLPQWAEPHGARWRFSAASLASGVAQCGSTQPLRTVLRTFYASIPTALAALIATADQPPTVRLSTRTILDVASATTLDTLLQNASLGRGISRRLSPTSVVIAPHAVARVVGYLRRRGLLPPDTESPAALRSALVLQALALRIAAASQPAYAAPFTALAHTAFRALTPAEQTDLDDQWHALARTLAPRETVADQALDPAAAPPPGTPDRVALVAAVHRGITSASLLTMRYYAATTHTISTRTIRPLELRGVYLRAHCQRANAERTFHIDRILTWD